MATSENKHVYRVNIHNWAEVQVDASAEMVWRALPVFKEDDGSEHFALNDLKPDQAGYRKRIRRIDPDSGILHMVDQDIEVIRSEPFRRLIVRVLYSPPQEADIVADYRIKEVEGKIQFSMDSYAWWHILSETPLDDDELLKRRIALENQFQPMVFDGYSQAMKAVEERAEGKKLR